MLEFYNSLSTLERVGLALLCAVGAHVVVRLIRWGSLQVMSSGVAKRSSKSLTLISLISSTLVFALYFAAVGFVLGEAGVPLSTYLASASIIGLAVAFGSQGIVQDVVSGITIVFTDLFDIGDVVEISGQVGIVERFGMRFTVLRNPMGAEIFVPNRSILNVIAYPRGYVRCFVDVTLPEDGEASATLKQRAEQLCNAASEQFPGIFRAPPEFMGAQQTASGRRFVRMKFRVWPGRGGPLETAFRQEVLQAAKAIEPAYADWMVSVNFEVETYTRPRNRT